MLLRCAAARVVLKCNYAGVDMLAREVAKHAGGVIMLNKQFCGKLYQPYMVRPVGQLILYRSETRRCGESRVLVELKFFFFWAPLFPPLRLDIHRITHCVYRLSLS